MAVLALTMDNIIKLDLILKFKIPANAADESIDHPTSH